MTTAKLVGAPAQGHGLTQAITDKHFAMAVKGEPVPMLPCVVMLKQVGFDEKETAQGKHRSVRYEVSKIEPILDANAASEVQLMALALYKQRTTPDGEQSMLPISFPGQQDEEKRRWLMEQMESWADDQGMPIADLEQAWRDKFGVGDPETNLYSVPGDYRLASVNFLSQFCFDEGVIADEDEQAEIPPAVFSSGSDSLDVEDDDPLAGEGEEPEVAAEPKSKPRSRAAKNADAALAAVPDAE